MHTIGCGRLFQSNAQLQIISRPQLIAQLQLVTSPQVVAHTQFITTFRIVICSCSLGNWDSE